MRYSRGRIASPLVAKQAIINHGDTECTEKRLRRPSGREKNEEESERKSAFQ